TSPPSGQRSCASSAPASFRAHGGQRITLRSQYANVVAVEPQAQLVELTSRASAQLGRRGPRRPWGNGHHAIAFRVSPVSDRRRLPRLPDDHRDLLSIGQPNRPLLETRETRNSRT